MLAGLDRGMCVDCGGIRPYQPRTCQRCNGNKPPRAIRVGDRILGTRRHESAEMEFCLPADSPPDDVDPMPSAEALHALLLRVRKLPCKTEIHIPTTVRVRNAKIVNGLFLRIIAKDVSACYLEEMRSKCLLGMVPKNRNRKVELTIRLNLWFKHAFEELVTRIEIQNGIHITGRPTINNSKSKGQRAKHLVKEGARARAVISLTSELADLTPEEEEAFAGELLPQSVRPMEALSGGIGVAEIDEVGAETELGYGLKGVRFKTLSAPGPSGARPEHLKELLACGNKRVAREFARNIGKFVAATSEGHLPEEARFILDSRLVYLRKKHGKVPRPIRVGELWRRVIAKRLVFDNQTDVASVCKQARQFGVGLPGGADVLVHMRLVLERMCVVKAI